MNVQSIKTTWRHKHSMLAVATVSMACPPQKAIAIHSMNVSKRASEGVKSIFAWNASTSFPCKAKSHASPSLPYLFKYGIGCYRATHHALDGSLVSENEYRHEDDIGNALTCRRTAIDLRLDGGFRHIALPYGGPRFGL